MRNNNAMHTVSLVFHFSIVSSLACYHIREWFGKKKKKKKTHLWYSECNSLTEKNACSMTQKSVGFLFDETRFSKRLPVLWQKKSEEKNTATNKNSIIQLHVRDNW